MKRHFLLWLLLAIAGVHETCSSQSASLPKGYKDWYIGSFRCGVYVPPSYDPARKYPLVIYLHGKSDTTTRNIGWYHEPAALADPCIVLTPKCPLSETGEWGNSWSAENPPMIQKTFEMIELVRRQYHLDEDRFYIYGISMGAIGTFGLIQKFPNLFAGGYAVCGWADPKMAPQLADLPFWLFHGAEDDIVPVEGSRGIYRAVLAQGGRKIRYTEFKGVKHDSWKYLRDNEVIAWLLAQKKGVVHGPPGKVTAFQARITNPKQVLLAWQGPSQSSSPDNRVWYYKIYRNNDLIAEVDGDQLTYTDSLAGADAAQGYKISAVNYTFGESTLSETVQVRPGPER